MKRILLLLMTTVAVLSLGAPVFACGRCGKADCCGPICSYNPCIKYVDRARCLGCCDCGPSIQTALQVKDPCSCCIVDVPVCLPACCTGEPCVDAKCGLLGNGKIFYTWNCGYEVKVVLNKRGDITVLYLGH